jgi:ketosteroid isomerase-like protein
MTTTTNDSILDRTRDLQDYIASGRVLEAMDEFYADNVSMQDGNEKPCVGLQANIEREKAWLDNVSKFSSFQVLSMGVHGDTSFVESSMDFTTKDGTEVHMEQVSRARWKDGKIVDERFYSV